MGEIIHQPLAVETLVHESTDKVGKAESKERATGLTSIGYDDEIGLWEEQLHRGNHSKINID
jgi:hypothetical protein